MRVRDILREARDSALAQRIPTIMVALLASAMCLVTLLTVGRTAHAEIQVQAALEAAGSRVLTVESAKPELDLLRPEVTDTIATLSIAHTAIAASYPQDVVLSAVQGSDRTPMWWLRGDLAQVATLTGGRWPEIGEAVVSSAVAATYGLDGAAGALLTVGGAEVAVVGVFTAREPFTNYAAGALTPDDGKHQMSTVTVVATSAADASGLQSAVLQVIGSSDPQALRISSPATLADVQQTVGADLTLFSRSLLLLVLIAGGVLTAVVVLADVLVRQRDLGRRRALGADRYSIVALVTTRTLAAALAGVALGTAVGTAVGWSVRPPLTFTVGVATLAVIAASVAAVPPAMLAAYRDPVAVLRSA